MGNKLYLSATDLAVLLYLLLISYLLYKIINIESLKKDKIFAKNNVVAVLLLVSTIIGHSTYQKYLIYQEVKQTKVTVRIAPKEIRKWIENEAKNSKGWHYVHWESESLATLNKNTNEATNRAGFAVAHDLNQRFLNTNSKENNLGGYLDTGVFVHNYDDFAEKSSDLLFILQNETIATTYLRADIVKNLKYPIYNEIFAKPYVFTDKVESSAGVIYNKIDNISSMVFCMFPKDAWSTSRHRQCGYREQGISKKNHKDYKKEIDIAWKNKSGINICALDNINDFQSYYAELKQDFVFCGIGNDKRSFDLFINVSKQMLKEGFHENWNEVTLRVDKDKYVDAVEAIFYFYATKEDYYISPVGRLKKYNINLAKAQYYQKELYDREKVF